jgi:hypothetical protein
MATILELEARGELHRLQANLRRRQQPERTFFASKGLVKWFAEDLPKAASAWNLETSPLEQVDVLLNIFVSGEVLAFQLRFWPLNPRAEHVWELKTPDARIFGWFVARDCFVGVVANFADAIKAHKLYQGHVGQVARFRDHLKLDEPKSMVGEEPGDVVSNFAFP